MSNGNQGPTERRQNPMFDQEAGKTGMAGKPQRRLYDQDAQRPARTAPSGQPQRSAAPQRRTGETRGAAGPAQPARKIYTAPSSGGGAKRGAPQGNKTARSNVRGTGGGKKPPRKKRRKWLVALVAVGVLLAVVCTGVLAAYNVIQDRMRPDEDRGDGTTPEELNTLPEFEGDSVSFLVCGIDYNNETADGYVDPNDKVGNTDMILYVYYNIKANKASIMQMPRDVYVGDKVNTGGTGKINGLYRNADDTKNRMAALSRVIYDQFALPVDFYVSIDMDALKEIVDIKGWIEVYVPETISDPDHPETRLEAGWRNLTGEQVEFLLRNRKSPNYNDQGDIARLRTQQSFYSAIFREFKTLSPTNLLMWMNVLTYRCTTDASLLDLGGIAQKALSLEGEDLTLVRPACAPVMNGSYQLVSLLPEEMADVLNEYFRPEGQTVPLSQLNIHSLPITEQWGYVETEIKTMADVQNDELPLGA